MIVLKPRSGRVTLTGRKLYNAMLYTAQARLEAMAELPRADFLFEAPLASLLRVSGGTGEERTAAKRYLREMRGLEVDWETTAPGDGLKWRGFAMLAEVAVEVRRGENWVTWAYPPAILTAIREPQRWARIDLEVLAKLGTYASLALYEICARYRDNPSFVTSRKPCEWWIDALSAAPAGSERREWRKFKNERVQPAIEEISSTTDLQIELIEHKAGRQVVEVQFAVRKRSHVGRQIPQAADADLVLLGVSLGVVEERLDRLVMQFGEAAVRRELQSLARRVANRVLAPLNDRYAYLRTVLANAPTAGVNPPAPETTGIRRTETVAFKVVDPTPPAAHANPPPTPVSQADDASSIVIEVKRRLMALTAESRQRYVDLAMESLKARGLLVATIKRRAEQGDIFHGMLGYAVAEQYAREELGIELAAGQRTA